MGVPFQGSPECMQDTDEAGDEVFAFVQPLEELKEDTADSLEKAVKQGTVIKEELAEGIVNGKDEMAVCTVKQLKRDSGGAVNGVFVATGGAESGMAAEGDKFQLTTMWASKHGTAIGRIPTISHFLKVFHDDRAWLEKNFNFLIMFVNNLL